jgi:uncharacterized membrane protein YjfL (UPF0719 family)
MDNSTVFLGMELIWVLYGTGYVVAALLALYIAKELFDLVTPYKLRVQLSEKDNPAVGVVLFGYLLGVIAVVCGAFVDGTAAEGTPLTLVWFFRELGPVALFTALGMLLLLLAGLINDKLILHGFSNTKEIVDDQNVSVAIIISAGYIGSGLIIAGAISKSVELVWTVVAFLLGQLALVVFGLIYRWATSYDDHDELSEKHNLAVGLAYAGNLLAFCLLMMRGLAAGVDDTWLDRLWHFGYYAVAGAVLLPLLRFVNDRLFLPGVRLNKEIVEDQNSNAGILEAGLAIAMGILLVFSL